MKAFFSSILFLLVMCQSSPLLAAPKGVVQTSSTGAFIGGNAPSLKRLDVTKEIKKGGRIYYQLKAIVERASGDKNGTKVIWAPKRYRDAIATLLGLTPGMVATLNQLFPKSIDNKKFPPVKMDYKYTLVFHGKGINNVNSKRAAGKKAFVEPIQFGFEPGTHPVTLQVCVELGNHPLLNAYEQYDLISTLADIPGWIAENLTPSGIAFNTALAVAKSRVGCSTVKYSFEVLAKVPNLKGKSAEKAREELSSRGLNAFVVQKNCKNVFGEIESQKPAAGKSVSAGTTVSLTECQRFTDVPTANFAGSWNTNFGPIFFNQDSDGNTAATYGWSGGGALFGKVIGRKMSGNYIGASGERGSFTITMASNNRSWAGGFKASNSNAKGAWSGSR
ncbi:MAG: PASTA domain-containing protein [Deltaproteobacteria bacterium]|nr:PASTA domain-containing protein [Deltaproteobacteria bacterium]